MNQREAYQAKIWNPIYWINNWKMFYIHTNPEKQSILSLQWNEKHEENKKIKFIRLLIHWLRYVIEWKNYIKSISIENLTTQIYNKKKIIIETNQKNWEHINKVLHSLIEKSVKKDIKKIFVILCIWLILDIFMIWTPPWTESIICMSLIWIYIRQINKKREILKEPEWNTYIDFVYNTNLKKIAKMITNNVHTTKILDYIDIMDNYPTENPQNGLFSSENYILAAYFLPTEHFFNRLIEFYKYIMNSLSNKSRINKIKTYMLNISTYDNNIILHSST